MRYLIIKVLFFVAFVIVVSSCAVEKDSNQRLNAALELAKNNRSELEKVLIHYNSDSLKYISALFLIENMPGHYSYQDSALISHYYREVDRINNKLKGRKSDEIRDSINMIARNLNLKNCKKVMDVEVISSDFLISNIESAFKAWKGRPWAAHLSFEEFCEYLLPYKVHELQPFDNWREEFATYCSDGLDNLKYCDMFKHSTFNASVILSKNLIDSIHPFLSWSLDFPIYKVSSKVKMSFGKCDDYADLMTSLFRAQGIPTVMDYTPQWAYRDLGHKWNCVLAQTGKNIPFSAFFTEPGAPHKIEEKLAKVFRYTYSINDDLKELNQIDKYVPTTFKSIFQKDVTREYINCSDVNFSGIDSPNGFVYLGVSDEDSWSPIHFAYCSDGNVSFKDMGLDCVYILMRYLPNGNVEYLSDPFILDQCGMSHYFIADSNNKQSAKLHRKYPTLEYASKYSQRMVGGRFEASNNSLFTNPDTIYVIQDGSAITQQVNISDSIGKYRYWRYIQSEPDTYCSIAEIIFYNRITHQPVYGKIIGTEGCKHPEYGRVKENVFDNNWLTSFDAPIDRDGWVGMDFGEPIGIEKIIFVGRGDGNSIELGDVYQLLYWDKDKWTSIGKQKATSSYVEFSEIPSNSILILKDLTKGKNIRIFTLNEENQQEWH